MSKEVILGLLIPFAGTTLGSLCVFFMKKEMNRNVVKALSGFAAGVMAAASVWSLLVPSIEQSAHMKRWSFLPAFFGFWAGILFLLLLDSLIPHLHRNEDKPEGLSANLQKSTMMLLAVTLHNIPEGMMLGVIYAAYVSGSDYISAGAALAMSLGIAIQNFPEGAIVSMPLYANGKKRLRAFVDGSLSGIVEPLFGAVTVFFSALIVPIMPFMLSFAAGAMMYVVVEELIPEMAEGEHSNIGVLCFSLGFTVMMALDIALG